MKQIPTLNEIQRMSDKEVAELNRQMTKRLIRNVVIYAVVKGAILYGVHRWARSVAETR